MTVTQQEYETLEAARAALHKQCASILAEGRRPVVLCNTHFRVTAERRALARANAGFGVEVATLSAWLADLWALYGDERALVGRPQRAAMLGKLLEKDNSSLPQTPGMVNFLCEVAADAFCYRNQPAELVGNEQALINIFDAYAEELSQAGLCEYSEALRVLVDIPGVRVFQPLVFDASISSFSAAELEFLSDFNATLLHAKLQATSCSERSAELTALADMLFRRTKDQAPVRPTGALIPALAAGPTAEHKAILGCIQDALEKDPQARIVVAARNPLAEFNYCAQALLEQGLNLRVQASKPLIETDAGRAVLSLLHLTQGGDVSKLESADFSFNPFAGMSYKSAFRLDQSNRSNRALDADDLLSSLAGNMDSNLQGVVALFEEQDFACAIDALEAHAQKHFAAWPVYLAEQMRALEASRGILAAAQKYDASATLVFESLASQAITLSYETHNLVKEDACAQVLFTSLAHVASLDATSADYVVIANLDASSYPIQVVHDSASTLHKKWGKERHQDPLLSLRTAFYRCILLARAGVYVQRCLNNAAAEPTQPATLFEELQDCYRVQLDDYADVDEHMRLATSLLDYAMYVGEDTPSTNLNPVPQSTAIDATVPPLGAIGVDAKKLLVLPRDYKGATFSGTDLSPSQIESYLECPYQWFVKRRLRIEPLDEGFGPVERGAFIHRVMQAFYETLQQSVAPKVTSENVSQAQAVLDQVFEEQLHRDMLEANKGERYYPADNHERQLIEDLHQQLRAALSFEAQFLPHFAPHLLEWEYGMPTPFEYAGCHITGRVDRIDVDGDGHAIVVDYKSSVSDEYCLLASTTQEEFVLPHKVQSLIYAQAVRKELGLDVVGALYFNVLSGEVYGAFDERIVGKADFPVAKSIARSSLPCLGIESFTQLLDTTEELIAHQMKHLEAGEIQAQPLNEHVCAYCPVGVCEKRRAERRA